MKEIPLTQGKVALVDDGDYELVSLSKWHARITKNNCYAGREYIKGRAILMHRLILDAPDGTGVDHINGNGLDNRRANLRLCTQAQNSANARKHIIKTSGYKGVSFDKVNIKWKAQIQINRRNLNLGRYVTEIEAALAYDDKARELFGEFANTNFTLHGTRLVEVDVAGETPAEDAGLQAALVAG